MAHEQNVKGHTITLPASGDLSSSQYALVAPTTAGQASVISARGARFIGSLQQGATAAGQASLIATVGAVSKVLAGDTSAGSAINFGDPLMGTSAGRAVPATTIANFTGAVALGSLTSGTIGIIPALLTISGPSSS